MGHFGKYTFYTVVYHAVVGHSGVASFSYVEVCYTVVDHSKVNLSLLFYHSREFLDLLPEFCFPLILVAAFLRSIGLLFSACTSEIFIPIQEVFHPFFWI